MTHEERREQRRALATAVADGEPINEICDRFGVGASTVYRACQEFGVPRRYENPVPSCNTLAIVAALLRGERQVEIARAHGVTQQWVSDIAKKCRAAGVPLPAKRASGTGPAKRAKTL